MMKYLIVGLGNIGAEYADTRHNIGFMIADELVKKAGQKYVTDKYAYYSELSFKGRKLHVIKPTTYMNLSGKAVNHWMHLLKIPVSNILVLVDDLAIPFGAIRLKPKGGSAGHNGLKSIESLCGGANYPRLRFGIGDDFPKGRQVDYVLGAFDSNEQVELPGLIDRSIEMIESFVSVGAELTMTRFNK